MRILIVILLLAISIFAWCETVYDIQFTEEPFGYSPLEGQVVTVTGIVSATNWYSGGSTMRFCITDPEGGAWRGIYVYNFDYAVELGDEVEVTATVQEYYGLTELSSVESVIILSSGNPVPAPVVVTTAELAVTEAYEGVLVQVNNVIVTQNPNDYGEAYISDGSGDCQTDDAMFNYNPVLGAEYEAIIGIVDYSYDEYSLNPRFSEDLGYSIEPGFITGAVSLAGGTGEVSDVTIIAGDYTINPGLDGFYLLEVAPGTYDVSAVLEGYYPGIIEDVVVEEQANVMGIDFELMPAGDTTIYDVQYTEDISGDSPLAGQIVTLTGIVTAYGFGGYENFFMSSPEGGAWNSIYVYQFDYIVEAGDEVTLTGTVSEYFGFTEIGYVTDLIIESSGNPIPDPVDISTFELSSSEAYESVLVRVNNVEVTIDPNEYGEAYIDDNSGECQLDDGFVINPQVVAGAEFFSITGVVDYSYDQYALHPRSLEDFDSEQNPEFTAIYDIQYTTDPDGTSPYNGEIVQVNGIVTGIEYNQNSFFLSSPEGGAWNGIYVFQFDYVVAEGDEVNITAEVQEYYGFTELSYITQLSIISSGNDLPAPVELTTAELASSEAYESVLVKVNDVVVTAAPNEYGEAYIDDGSGVCQIDDGFFINPEVVLGAEFVSITGLVDYSFDEYGLQPRYLEDFEGDTQVLPASIYDIQFTEDPSGDSPYIGQMVEVNGIVTGFGYNNSNYFFISSTEGGAWNGLYIYQFDAVVAVGDDVTIIGEINEYYGFTELGNIESMVVNSSGNTLPGPVEITTAELASMEAYESVLVKVNDVTVTSDVNEFGEAYISDGTGYCQLDDGFFLNPDVILGAEFTSIAGLVDYSYDEFALHPRNLDDFVTGVPWLYGDVTDDEMVDAFDAANILQYAVAMNPSGAPLPWTWELIAGDVDGNGEAEAYDAALILQYSVGIIDIFPVEESRATSAPAAQLVFSLQSGQLVASAQGDLYSAVIKINSNDLQISSPVYTSEVLQAVNFSEKQIAFASSTKLSGEIIKIPYQQNSIIQNIMIETTINGYHQNPVTLGNTSELPANAVLGIYPNPFNPETSIRLAVNDTNTHVQVQIYNVKGQLINTVFNGSLTAGIHNLKWNGTDQNGETAGSGVYFYKAQIGNQISSGKMLMLK